MAAAKRQLHIVHLYPKELNIYGDNGNLLVLQQRLQWRNIDVKITKVGLRQKLPEDIDIILGGGGQDKGQFEVEKDLQLKKAQLNRLAKDGVTMLMICGMYQLFGHRFITKDRKILRGISIFDAHTAASEERLIGNVVINTPFGQIVGFENHSGQTHLGAGQEFLGDVVRGSGNNSTTKKEGAIKNNVFGSYLHGPMLPKNPKFADELIARALQRKYGDASLSKLDDELALRATDVAAKRT